MNISSTPFIRNDYWPDYNDIDILNKRIDEAENETSLVNSRLTNDIENVSNNLNSYKNAMADAVITNNIIVNNLNANYAVGKYANFANTNTDNAYIENLTVNKPVFDITLNTPHVENITSIGGNFYDANLFNVAVENLSGVLGNVEINNAVINTANVAELFVNTSIKPVTSSAVLGYDSEGRVIPIKAAFEVGFPENANYLYTDQHGTAFKGIAETEANASDNLITSYAVYNALANVNNSFNNVNNSFNNVNNSFNNVNNTANNLLDNIDYLKNIVESSLLPANITGWNSSTYPVIIQGITEFVVEPLSADYYPISPESDRICINNNYYEKSGNNYIKQSILTYNTYNKSLQVDWSENNKYTAESEFDETISDFVTRWKTNSGTVASSGYYLGIDTKTDNTFEVRILNLAFNNGVSSNEITVDRIYKLPDSLSLQDNKTYIKNGNSFEALTVNQGGSTFTSDPANDSSFYLYQKGADWPYPNTTGPEYSILALNNVYAGVYSASSFPLYTEMGTMTAYVSDKAKLSVSGTKATLALPGFQWTMGTMTETFAGCNAFNQNIKIPNGVTELSATFLSCNAFNQNIKIPNSVTKLYGPFCGCLVFNQNILIPNSVTNMMEAFGALTLGPGFKDTSCPNLNQCILIPNSVTDMTSCFRYCNNLNQPDMYIYSQNITSMTYAFQGCHINNIHIPTSVPKDTSNFMYNCLINGDTGITFPASNIFNDLPVDIKQWPPV